MSNGKFPLPPVRIDPDLEAIVSKTESESLSTILDDDPRALEHVNWLRDEMDRIALGAPSQPRRRAQSRRLARGPEGALRRVPAEVRLSADRKDAETAEPTLVEIARLQRGGTQISLLRQSGEPGVYLRPSGDGDPTWLRVGDQMFKLDAGRFVGLRLVQDLTIGAVKRLKQAADGCSLEGDWG